MAEQPRKKSVFAMAHRSASVTVELCPEDVLHMRPSWSRDEAEAFLLRYGTTIAERILAAGLGAVLALIEAEEKQCHGPTN